MLFFDWRVCKSQPLFPLVEVSMVASTFGEGEVNTRPKAVRARVQSSNGEEAIRLPPNGQVRSRKESQPRERCSCSCALPFAPPSCPETLVEQPTTPANQSTRSYKYISRAPFAGRPYLSSSLFLSLCLLLPLLKNNSWLLSFQQSSPNTKQYPPLLTASQRNTHCYRKHVVRKQIRLSSAQFGD